MKTITTFLCCISISICFSQDLELDLFATGLDQPVNIKHAGDDRLFVVEQDGRIRIVNSDGTVESTPFLDIDGRVRNLAFIGDERGLLGLAFHPDYASNGYFFVNYINNSGNTVVSRFSRNMTNPSLADPNSELIILTYNQPFTNHNGGDLAFGADGYLYISSGDGGSGGDPQNNAQNLGNLLGKILRIDVNNSTVSNPYDIPSDNPFVSNGAASDEIWAYGLRNPWKFSFDRLTNDIWIADVGQNAFEEINLAGPTEAGLNYGWRCYEANDIFNNSGCPASSTLTFPVSEYSHSFDGEFKCSITGGYRYRGTTYPNFEGLYFFADYCSEEIGFLRNESGSWNMTLEGFSGDWVAFGEDVNGELYVSSLSGGNIFRLTDALLSVDENALNTINIYPNPAKDILYLDFSGSGSAVSTEISIFDIQGKKVRSLTSTNETVQNIAISDLKSGFYLLKIETNDGRQRTEKFVIN
ncbi:PQQ-dependent sugar dehydrogenase [Winogradskyella tangerina]|uniref:PQQ-dependent sugar dehydrogenase n=1 Tax=Winogradskyella tangerina TaxID=2023240 RepID=UPI000DBE6497|nr:PQQ-dependent sugar dehydrogenase [Winogradskyella tangerina]